MPQINTDSEFGKSIGFTSDKFDGWLWTNRKFIWISFIISNNPGKGHFKALLDTLEERGYKIIVPTPFPLMQEICEKRNMKLVLCKHRFKYRNHSVLEPIEVMIKEEYLDKAYKQKILLPIHART